MIDETKNNQRYINAYDFAEIIENLDITVAGKPARWNDAKYTVLKELAEAPTSDVVEKRDCEKCIHFVKHATEYPCSHCRNCYTDKFLPAMDGKPQKEVTEE